ncbi:MAG: acyl-ACP--UDP-N-acetylglucosamine O-acyltransferase [Candidatus Zixiibacteriota bacterium]|nr:MAG: acyl-ACP--UDP-N-acetylglucosamine O-acyltransferase [candidate division Zixibacteria bacterium]
MTEIHKTAIVSPGAQLGTGVSVGPYAIIQDDVQIGDGSSVASCALVASGARVGSNVKIHHGAVVSTIPQDLKFAGEKSTTVIGDGTNVREYATVNRGTSARGETTIGKNCMLMSYSHVGHDCLLGDSVIMSNSVNLAGHVEIGDCAILGGVLPVHQFVKIGPHVMIGGGFRVQQDVCPYALVAGYPLKVIGINSVGLKRRGFDKEVIRTLEKTFKILFFSKLNTSQALERIKGEIEPIAQVQEIVDFFENSERGVIK